MLTSPLNSPASPLVPPLTPLPPSAISPVPPRVPGPLPVPPAANTPRPPLPELPLPPSASTPLPPSDLPSPPNDCNPSPPLWQLLLMQDPPSANTPVPPIEAAPIPPVPTTPVPPEPEPKSPEPTPMPPSPITPVPAFAVLTPLITEAWPLPRSTAPTRLSGMPTPNGEPVDPSPVSVVSCATPVSEFGAEMVSVLFDELTRMFAPAAIVMLSNNPLRLRTRVNGAIFALVTPPFANCGVPTPPVEIPSGELLDPFPASVPS